MTFLFTHPEIRPVVSLVGVQSLCARTFVQAILTANESNTDTFVVESASEKLNLGIELLKKNPQGYNLLRVKFEGEIFLHLALVSSF